MSVMEKELEKVAKQDKSHRANYGDGTKYLRLGMRKGLQFPPRTHAPTLPLVHVEKADKSPLRKVHSNHPGLTMLGTRFVMHLILASACQDNLFVLSLCISEISVIAHHHSPLAS